MKSNKQIIFNYVCSQTLQTVLCVNMWYCLACLSCCLSKIGLLFWRVGVIFHLGNNYTEIFAEHLTNDDGTCEKASVIIKLKS